MTITETYAPGTFCWCDLGTTDAAAAKRFYTGLFGWEFQDMPMGPDQYYTMFTLNGKNVCALYQVSPEWPTMSDRPAWLSYITVESADQGAKRVKELGGKVTMEPFDVMDVGRQVMLQDPTGAHVALWEPKRHPGAGVYGELNAVCWYELTTNDPKKAGRFYSELLGWQTVAQPMGDFVYTLFRKDDQDKGGMFELSGEMADVPPFWLVYFGVDDCDAKTAKAKSLGAEVVRPPTDIPGVGRFSILADPQGTAFALIQPNT
jgi:predicted enzyme related to lactoylglutathione lyase